jgi:trehalose 6-phosphate phosphatase
MDKNVVEQSSHRWFFEAVAKAPRRLLLVEYEAALAPPWNSHAPYPGISDRLECVLNDRRTRLVVISSGLAKDVRHVLGMQVAPEIWGCDGLERLCADGHYERAKLDIPTEALEALAESEIWLRRNGLGMFLEVRLAGICVHWRGLSDIDDLLDVRAKAYQVFRPLALRYPSLRFHAFEGGVELRLSGTTVGNALHHLLSSITSETPVAYIGDDRADPEPFEVLNDRDLTVVIRLLPRSEEERTHRKPPQEFTRFLDEWIRTTQSLL